MTKTIQTPQGQITVERLPGNWKMTAGALGHAANDIEVMLAVIEEQEQVPSILY